MVKQKLFKAVAQRTIKFIMKKFNKGDNLLVVFPNNDISEAIFIGYTDEGYALIDRRFGSTWIKSVESIRYLHHKESYLLNLL